VAEAATEKAVEPAGVLRDPWTVRTEVWPAVICVGENVAATPAGKPATFNVAKPENPVVLLMLIA
jgi:hypothetical protein